MTPSRAMALDIIWAISSSTIARMQFDRYSMIVTLHPLIINASATSRPTRPAPITTARFPFDARDWMPLASSIVLSTKTPGLRGPWQSFSRNAPLTEGTDALAPVARMIESYGISTSLPSALTTLATLPMGSTRATFAPRRMPMRLFFSLSSGASIRLVSSGMTPDIPYGSPHREYWGYVSRSIIVISAFLSVFLANCAAVPPPHPPPTMTILFAKRAHSLQSTGWGLKGLNNSRPFWRRLLNTVPDRCHWVLNGPKRLINHFRIRSLPRECRRARCSHALHRRDTP